MPRYDIGMEKIKFRTLSVLGVQDANTRSLIMISGGNSDETREFAQEEFGYGRRRTSRTNVYLPEDLIEWLEAGNYLLIDPLNGPRKPLEIDDSDDGAAIEKFVDIIGITTDMFNMTYHGNAKSRSDLKNDMRAAIKTLLNYDLVDVDKLLALEL